MSDLKEEVAKLAREYPEGSNERRKVQALLQEEPMNITASDRKALIKLAGALPKGSAERRSILSGLKTAGQWGSNAYVKDGVWEDVIVNSPNGDSLLVGGRETYPDDIPTQAMYVAEKMLKVKVPKMSDSVARKVQQKIDRTMEGRDFGYNEISIKYDPAEGWSVWDGRWHT